MKLVTSILSYFLAAFFSIFILAGLGALTRGIGAIFSIFFFISAVLLSTPFFQKYILKKTKISSQLAFRRVSVIASFLVFIFGIVALPVSNDNTEDPGQVAGISEQSENQELSETQSELEEERAKRLELEQQLAELQEQEDATTKEPVEEIPLPAAIEPEPQSEPQITPDPAPTPQPVQTTTQPATNTQTQITTPTPTPQPQSNCDPSYPTICFPSSPDIDCGEISHKDFTVLQPDPHGFDRDKDGIGCES